MGMYKYKIRPGYQSEELLIEFAADAHDEQFIADLLSGLKSGGVGFDSFRDLVFMHLVDMNSPAGPFQLEVDEWHFVWISAAKNQDAIHGVDRILQDSGHFEKEEVNYEDYA